MIDISLVGGIPTPLKNRKVSWDYYSQYMERCSQLILTGGFNASEKYEFVNGKDDIPYIMET